MNLGGIKLELAAAFTLANPQGITLAPGAFAILSANPQAFSTRYPGVPNVLGPFAGDLDNDGERIVLKNVNGTIICDFTFDDLWHPTTDGGGRTLAIYNPTGAFSSAANWRASAAIGGSPGANEPNLAPTVSAGADIAAYLPSTPLAGSADDDTLPAPFTAAWSKMSGPGVVTFANSAAPVTTATFAEPGAFTLRLTANGTALAVSDEVILADDGIIQTIRATDNAPAGTARFIRLKVTPP